MIKSYKTTNRRQFLKSLGLAATAFPFAVGCAFARRSFNARKKLRNVIFILSDDHRYDFMGFLNKPKFLETPNMDRMAREGAYIKNATVSTALCSPSRASILTGQFAHRHGVVDNNTRVPAGTRFFPQDLQKAGWQTAFMGKWHMGHASDEPRPGFNKWVSFKGQGVYSNPTFNVDGKQVKRQGHVSDLLTDYALDWLKNDREQDKPFFLYLSHKAVHAMFEPAQRHHGKYDDVKLEYPKSMANTEENYKGKPQWVKEQRNSWHGVDHMYHGQMDFDTFYRRYCETLLSVDESIGRVIKYLESNNLAEDTLVMYMGDNGFVFGEHGLIDKRHMYEESMRVPFLAWCPGMIKSGSVVEELIQNIDIAPTVMDIAGLKIPERMDGQPFLPVLQGKKIPWRDAAFYEYYWERNFPHTPTTHGVRTNRYKYIHYHGIWDIDELYDLKNDPDEMTNLIDSPEHQDLITQLNSRMFEWLEKSDGMLIPLRRDQGFRAIERNPEKIRK
ncbi:MAG: sulfatase [Planctomycetes bacterium]|nr:sulfatase [Planctomycetota bacterium]MBL7145658.1 sulfatase [Phycisphaerae bacterium]